MLAAEPVTEVIPLRRDEDGVIRVGHTRVTLDTVVAAWENGSTAERIVEDYDTLALADVHFVIGYFLVHRGEVAAYLEQRQRIRDEVRRQNEARWPPEGLRQRILSRRQA